MSYRSEVLADSPAVFWFPGIEAGGTQAWDYSGNGRHGEYRNTPTFGAAGPLTSLPVYKTLTLAGASFQSTRVLSASYNPFTVGTTRTFECWGYVVPNATNPRLFGSDGTNHFKVVLVAESGTFPCSVTFRPDSTTGVDVTWASAWPAKEQWVHLALIFNDSANTAELFINGESKGSKEATGVFGATPGNLLAGGDASVHLNGRLGPFAVYESALSASRIKAHYEAALAAPATPAKRIYWGALMEGEVYAPSQLDSPYLEATTNTFKEHAGRKPGIIHFSDPITETGPTWDGFGAGASAATHTYGAIVLKSIGGPSGIVAKTNEGATDAKWTTWAEAAKSFGRPMFLRPMWEMNGTTWAWSRAFVTAAEYKAAWQRIYSIVSPIAKNVTFVWCPNVLFGAETAFASWYPGNGYVDWTGLDGYNEGAGGWRGGVKTFSESLTEMASVAPGKPVLIGETSSVEEGGTKADWFRDLLGQTFAEVFPQIKGYVHYNNSNSKPYAIESSVAAQEAFKAGIESQLFVNPEVETFNKQTKVVAFGEPLPTPGSEGPQFPLSPHDRIFA